MRVFSVKVNNQLFARDFQKPEFSPDHRRWPLSINAIKLSKLDNSFCDSDLFHQEKSKKVKKYLKF